MKKTFTIVVSVLLAVLGLLLTLATPAGWIFVALGVALVIYAAKYHSRPSAPAPRVYAPEAPHRSTRRSSNRSVKVVGVTFACNLDDTVDRQAILADMNDGDPVELQEYTYKGSPAFLVVDSASGLDIGNLPASVAEKLSGRSVSDAYVAEIGEFENESGDLIRYAKIAYSLK